MAKNQVFKGTRPALSLPVPAGTKSGSAVLVGGIVGVTEGDRRELVNGVQYGTVGSPDGYAPVAPDGCYALPVADAVASVGTKIYIVTADNSLTITAGSNTLFGTTVPVIDKGVASGATKASGADTVNVQIATPRTSQ